MEHQNFEKEKSPTFKSRGGVLFHCPIDGVGINLFFN